MMNSYDDYRIICFCSYRELSGVRYWHPREADGHCLFFLWTTWCAICFQLVFSGAFNTLQWSGVCFFWDLRLFKLFLAVLGEILVWPFPEYDKLSVIDGCGIFNSSIPHWFSHSQCLHCLEAWIALFHSITKVFLAHFWWCYCTIICSPSYG